MNHRHPARQHRHHIMLYHRARALRLNHQVHRQVKQRSFGRPAYPSFVEGRQCFAYETNQGNILVRIDPQS